MIKQLLYIALPLLFLMACGERQPKTDDYGLTAEQRKQLEADDSVLHAQQKIDSTYKAKTDSILRADSIWMTTEGAKRNAYYKKHFRIIKSNDTIGNQTLARYLADTKIPITFRNVFLQKQPLMDDEKTLAITDSLFSNDSERHPFYFVLVTRAMWWSDGAYSEPLFMAAKRYVEERPQQFIHYFVSEPVLTNYDLQQWATGVACEIGTSCNDAFADCVKKLKAKMLKSCVNCTPEEKEVLNKFIRYLIAWENNTLVTY